MTLSRRALPYSSDFLRRLLEFLLQMLNVARRFIEGVLKFLLCQLRLAQCGLRTLHFLTETLDFTHGLVALAVITLYRRLMTLELLFHRVLLLLCVLQARLEAIHLTLTLLELLLKCGILCS
jgi:hypothetical protein